jgi:membrane-bound lytic murein transglycosylase
MRVQSGGIGRLAAGLAIFVAVVALPGLAQASCLPTVERQRIEALIGAVERRADVTFIRNGRSYRAATAAQFLRGKWRDREADVCSADDFIAKVASFSSTTGNPYLVRLRDGREVPAAEFFRAQLAQLTTAP